MELFIPSLRAERGSSKGAPVNKKIHSPEGSFLPGSQSSPPHIFIPRTWPSFSVERRRPLWQGLMICPRIGSTSFSPWSRKGLKKGGGVVLTSCVSSVSPTSPWIVPCDRTALSMLYYLAPNNYNSKASGLLFLPRCAFVPWSGCVPPWIQPFPTRWCPSTSSAVLPWVTPSSRDPETLSEPLVLRASYSTQGGAGFVFWSNPRVLFCESILSASSVAAVWPSPNKTWRW